MTATDIEYETSPPAAPEPQPQPAQKPDLDVILPAPAEFEVAGIPAVVKRLKSREFLHLMRVLTRGLGAGIRDIRLDTDDPEALQRDMVALFILAVPNAIDEFGLFMLSIVEAKDRTDQARLQQEMVNPDPDVLIDIITIVAEQEKDDLHALVGKGRAALARIQGLYQPAAGSSGRSRAPST